MDTPLVLYRDRRGVPHALADRCPHRNMPLSLGRVHHDGTLECAYHGWRFDGAGRCTAVPGLDQPGPSRAREVLFHAVCERDGFVWVWGEPGRPPAGEPFALPDLGGGSGQVVLERDLDCTLLAALENTLDVPHTAFLHRGLFRGGRTNPVTAVRRALPDGVEVRYLGEPVAFGRLRLPVADVTFDHWDRFFLPSVAQVEYRVRDWIRVVTTVLHLPVSPFRTRAWFVVRFRSVLPPALVGPVVAARGRQILGQDAGALAAQLANVRRFGGERFVSTELDIMGNAIWRLLREAERAESSAADGPAAATVDDAGGRVDDAGGRADDAGGRAAAEVDDAGGPVSSTFRI
jgi:nitrite reductase/ring-hydroxylating ferredoxin subunit